jgi:hypothetical protein
MNYFITSIKYFLLSTFIVSSIFLNGTLLVSAQENIELNETVVGDVGEQINVSDISLLVPTFEDKIYKSGDTVSVSVPVINNDPVDYPEMTFSAQITVYAKDGKIKEYGRQDNLTEFFLSKKSSKDVSFNYTIPTAISSSSEDTIRIEVQAIQKTGELFGNTSNFIKVEHIQIPFEVSLAGVNVGEKFYTLQEGPVVSSEEIIQITTLFTYTEKETVTLYPKLKIYDLDTSRPLLETKEYDSIELTESSYFQTFVFDLPQMSKPGVYVAELIFVDQNGIPQTSLISARWIIDGDMATISRVSLDKTTLKKGESALVDVMYTGAPENIDTGEARQVGKGMMTVNLYNEKEEIIGSQEKEVDFSITRNTTQFEITATDNAKSITVQVIASKNGQELANYKTNVSNPEMQDTNPIIEILSLVAIVLILLVVVLVHKKIISKKIIIPGLVILMFLGITQVSYASRVVVSNDLYVHNNLNKTTFTPGEDMKWNLPTQIQAYACNNQGGNTTLNWSIGGNGYWATGQKLASYPAVANTCKAKDVNCNFLFAANIHAESWRLIDAFYPDSLNAPSAPGTYTLTVNVWHKARFKDGGTSNPIQKGPATFSYSFTVACPAGQNWNGWGCVNPPPPPVAGSCNPNPTIWSCASGTADNGNSDSWNVWWRCAGSNGGADAWCSIPLAPAPTGISTQCSPAGNAVAMYWTNQPGYDRVYFRNHDNSAGAYYGYLDDYQNNWAYLTGITPGHSYNWWIHTRRWDGLWSAAVGEGYVCSVQQPSNLKVSCSADGRTATFSWTNPGAYNRVYFRNHDYTGGYDVAYGDNNDVWGNTYTINGITPGNSYGWWIHTRDAVGNYGPAVSGNFTCSAAPVDQCVNVGGVQTTVPASANKNADGTCSCWAGKHFEGALCVNDTPPVVPTLSVSCSASSVVLNSESKFEASVQNSTGAVTYKWKEKDNTTYISGATNSIFKRTYSTVGSHRLYIEAKDDKSTITNFCNATVDCDSSHFEGQKVCDANTGIESTWSCSTNGWSESKGSCSGTTPGTYTGVNPEVGTFTFTPEIVADTSGKCGITLSATNVSSCTLTAPGATPIFIPGSLGAISKINEKIISVGRYNLSCTGMGVGAVTKQFGFKTCSLNADVRER